MGRQIDYFLKLGEIEGESKDSTHQGEIEVDSWAWKTEKSSYHGSGASRVQPIIIGTQLSKATPLIVSYHMLNRSIKKAVLTCRKAGGTQQEYFKIILEDVLISAYELSGSDLGNIVPSEHITLNFRKFTFEYREQKANGFLAGTNACSFDLGRIEG
jgi:type VI secretion system secreted protein Hcp